MDENKFLSFLDGLMSKGIFSKLKHHTGAIVQEVTRYVPKESIFEMIDRNIDDSDKRRIQSKVNFLREIKNDWDTIPENIRTKIHAILYIEDKITKNFLTSSILVKYYHDYKK